MSGLSRRMVQSWVALGPRFMPFADLTSEDLTWSRLLRLSLFQVSVGMTLVLLAGTLNRVMIVELNVAALLVGGMLALPLLFAPFRALVGFRSDTHRSELGWRRTPFIWRGTLLQFGGFAIMPFALLVLAGMGESADAPWWFGHLAAALAILLTGAGAHIVQTAGLALATDLTPESSHPKVVGFMYVALLLGMLISALVFGYLLQDFSPGQLVKVIQGCAVAVVAINAVAIWKQEARSRERRPDPGAALPSFSDAWQRLCAGKGAVRSLTAVGIGTLAFGMADILLEPFGGQVLSLSVAETTRLTALLALGGLTGFGYATWSVTGGANPFLMAMAGVLLGVPAFVGILAALPLETPSLFLMGNFVLGFAGAVFAHATLTATMLRAPKDQSGLALGAWGGVQATAAGLGMALAGALRDGVTEVAQHSPAVASLAQTLIQTSAPTSAPTSAKVTELAATTAGYFSVYALEIILLLVAAIVIAPLMNQYKSNKVPDLSASQGVY